MPRLTQAEKDHDAREGYLVALHELRMRGIRDGTITNFTDAEWSEAHETTHGTDGTTAAELRFAEGVEDDSGGARRA